LHCETVIISTGATAKYLGLPSEQHYLKMVVFLLVQLRWFSIEIKRLLSWAGDSACEEAHYLSKLCKKSNDVSARSEKFRASKIMEARVRKQKTLRFL
jgi:thioredoxin reductase (NADPH)